MARRIHVPTLILWGKADKILSYKNAAGFRRHIPHADWVLMEGIGHAPMMEAPNKTANIVQRFLEKRIEKKKH
jgi:pimeloyl-ACP methyl ester carboxylesterase